MSYIRKMYLERQIQIENEAMENSTKDGVEARFVCNKIIKKYFRDYDKHGLRLNFNRLNRLAQLVDIVYRQENEGKPLIKDGYSISENGLFLFRGIINYEYLIKDLEDIKEFFAAREKDYQEMSEKLVGEAFNSKIDKIVSRVLTGTHYIDTVDLREMLNISLIQDIKLKFMKTDYDILPQEVVTELYEDFDFKMIEELNKREKEKLKSL